ncbi:hypothetical protein DQ783_16330 [Salmonella enterica subsp. enterica serovar Newport]|uniref:Uncharacterized protein n=2 Tax=Salmonella enterica I TaxID=59201 RepID=A0A5X8XX06_SALNE|nr:hypothetical protein [Salmonella enterica]EBS2909579.1 hypothetical protein [Salmonella enterica subsp. enterica serovar Flottbek]EBS4086067.1 hypothetical protein [Salmonella enterica subsp. enterica serovar Newport]ECC9721120.1 hypothetical protein [Salmonella enterica subsp. diarizonae]ECT8498614.1 hypothetical protein [Salmonella enterica subsp. enterica serovar Pensacola]
MSSLSGNWKPDRSIFAENQCDKGLISGQTVSVYGIMAVALEAFCLMTETGRSQQAWLTNPTVSSNLEAGSFPRLFRTDVVLTYLKRLYEGVAGSLAIPFSSFGATTGNFLSPGPLRLLTS